MGTSSSESKLLSEFRSTQEANRAVVRNRPARLRHSILRTLKEAKSTFGEEAEWVIRLHKLVESIPTEVYLRATAVLDLIQAAHQVVVEDQSVRKSLVLVDPKLSKDQQLDNEINNLRTNSLLDMVSDEITRRKSLFSIIAEKQLSILLEGYEHSPLTWPGTFQQLASDLARCKLFWKGLLRNCFEVLILRTVEISRKRIELRLQLISEDLISLNCGTLSQLVLAAGAHELINLDPGSLLESQVQPRKQLLVAYTSLDRGLARITQLRLFSQKCKQMLKLKTLIVRDLDREAHQQILLASDDFIAIFVWAVSRRSALAHDLWVVVKEMMLIGGDSFTAQRGQLSWLWAALETTFDWLISACKGQKDRTG